MVSDDGRPVGGYRLSAAEAALMLRQMETLLADIEAGRVDATESERARLEGGITVLAELLGNRPSEQPKN